MMSSEVDLQAAGGQVDETRQVVLDVSPSRMKHVRKALNTTRALGEEGYVHAVLLAYGQRKLKHGRTKFQLQGKFGVLERRMPHFGEEFRSVRRELGLAPSRVLPRREDPPPPPPYAPSYGCSCACTCGSGRMPAARAPPGEGEDGLSEGAGSEMGSVSGHGHGQGHGHGHGYPQAHGHAHGYPHTHRHIHNVNGHVPGHARVDSDQTDAGVGLSGGATSSASSVVGVRSHRSASPVSFTSSDAHDFGLGLAFAFGASSQSLAQSLGQSILRA